ncbi:MAG: DUF2085 domain-containing protein [Anaerolineaceae bacterium]
MRIDLRKSRIGMLVIIAFMGLLILWVTYTPEGLFGKLDAIGYAVCQQDPTHMLNFGERLLPLCSRCTGMYLGAFAAISYLLRQGKATQNPSRGKIAILCIFFLAFLVDGVNSTIFALAPAHAVYLPTNELRIITGMGMGMVIANVLLPLWNQTFWVEGVDRPVLRSWLQFGGLVLVEIAVGALVLSEMNWLFLPIVLLSTAMVPVLITMIYTLLGMVIFKRENLIHHWKEGILYVGFGAIAALVQIGLFDLLRFALTGTWQGIHF